jgi:putative ABC transport system permease protein
MYFLTEIKEGLAISFRAIRANKMRSVLTTLGIVIGIWAVTMMASGIDYINRSFERSSAAFGPDVMYVEKWPWVSGDDWWTFRNRRNFKVEYADQVERRATMLDAVAPVLNTRRPLKNGDRIMEMALISGTTDAYVNVSGNPQIDGRFFSAEESNGGRPVCVIGAVVAENLFEKEDPIGKTIRVGGHPFTVLGVFEKQGGLFGEFTSDSRVFIPLHTFQSKFGGRQYVYIQARAKSRALLDEAKLELEGIMRTIRKVQPGMPNDFSINQPDLLNNAFGPVSFVIAIVGGVITGLSLLVGSIGIMNIMFVSVTERTKEIGIRKAIGAKRRTILLQFLVEAAALCLIGGLIGLVLASVSVVIAGQVFDLDAVMPVYVVVLATLVALVTGLFAGILPAYRAAKMDPVEALRYE